MFIKENLRKDLRIALTTSLLISLLAWNLGFHPFNTAKAVGGNLTSVSDTLTDSRPGFPANHTIVYTNSTSTNASETIQITFDPTTSLFGGLGSVALADVTSTNLLIQSVCSAGANKVSMATSTTAITFTVCTGATVSTGTKTIQILNNKVTNPTSTGSYIIRIAGTQQNSADTRIAVVNGVNVTAAVATTFTFTVAGLATSTTLGNNATTTGLSTTTTLPFGTISPNTHAELGQQLTVTTNATNGFAVTVHEDQDMLSNTGNTIHLFKDGNATSVPSTWVSPSNTLNQPATFGHIGVTSDDADLGNGTFGTSTPKYAGAFQSTTTLTLFSATGTSDGVTQNIGAAKVAYRIEIGSLQPAANDYTNNLIYVATPTF